MTAHHDLDQQLAAFLRDGPTQLPDASFDAVRDRTDRTRQRVIFGPWRVPTVSKLVPIGLGAAAVIAVLFLGSRFIGSPSSNVGGPAVVASPSRPPSEAAPTSAGNGSLPEGRFLVADSGALAGDLRATVTIPSSGWMSNPEFAALGKGDDEDPPQSAMLFWSTAAGTGYDVYGDPCHWSSTKPATPAVTIDEIAAALAAQSSRDGSDPVDVTIGGHRAKNVILHVPAEAVFDDCDQGQFASYGHPGQSSPDRYQQGPGQIDELWIVDVDGAVAIIDAMYRSDTPAELIDEMRTIAESATFE